MFNIGVTFGFIEVESIATVRWLIESCFCKIQVALRAA